MVGLCKFGSLFLILGGHFLGPFVSNVNPYCHIYEPFSWNGARAGLILDTRKQNSSSFQLNSSLFLPKNSRNLRKNSRMISYLLNNNDVIRSILP